jgi:hypothetical protein
MNRFREERFTWQRGEITNYGSHEEVVARRNRAIAEEKERIQERNARRDACASDLRCRTKVG